MRSFHVGARPGLPGRALALACVLGLAAGCSAGGHKHATARAASHYGGYASYLPPATLHPHDDVTLTGTAGRPALASEGDAVRVKTTHWSVLVTVTGPEVPGEGLPFQAPATTCTWQVTMSAGTAPVPISAADFTSLDSLGNVYRMHFVPGQRKPPRLLAPGKKVTFELRTVEAVGEGLMRWAPDGRNITAKWDFEVEND